MSELVLRPEIGDLLLNNDAPSELHTLQIQSFLEAAQNRLVSLNDVLDDSLVKSTRAEWIHERDSLNDSIYAYSGTLSAVRRISAEYSTRAAPTFATKREAAHSLKGGTFDGTLTESDANFDCRTPAAQRLVKVWVVRGFAECRGRPCLVHPPLPYTRYLCLAKPATTGHSLSQWRRGDLCGSSGVGAPVPEINASELISQFYPLAALERQLDRSGNSQLQITFTWGEHHEIVPHLHGPTDAVVSHDKRRASLILRWNAESDPEEVFRALAPIRGKLHVLSRLELDSWENLGAHVRRLFATAPQLRALSLKDQDYSYRSPTIAASWVHLTHLRVCFIPGSQVHASRALRAAVNLADGSRALWKRRNCTFTMVASRRTIESVQICMHYPFPDSVEEKLWGVQSQKEGLKVFVSHPETGSEITVIPEKYVDMIPPPGLGRQTGIHFHRYSAPNYA
ncbi:hypothetical protein C8R43DRAFT_943379 [Mycena crocata]|nr:hypothetical protein C8R43DRAFT_943379 [Mycena crocata]